jgi:hypothetical protein
MTFPPDSRIAGVSRQRLVPYYTTKAHKVSPRRSVASSGNRSLKHTVEYLSICNDPSAYSGVVRASSDPVIKTICNAALNVERGDIRLTAAQKKLFAKHRKQIAKLTSRRVALDSKRRLLEQRGSGFFIPALIGAAITGLAGSLFGGKKE